jgi:hypothetical protein
VLRAIQRYHDDELARYLADMKRTEKARRKPKRRTKQQRVQQAAAREQEKRWQVMWKAEGRSLADYKAGIDDMDSEVWEWRRAKSQAANKALREAWLRDHPGNPLPEHLCGLSQAEYAAYEAWEKKCYGEEAP